MNFFAIADVEEVALLRCVPSSMSRCFSLNRTLARERMGISTKGFLPPFTVLSTDLGELLELLDGLLAIASRRAMAIRPLSLLVLVRPARAASDLLDASSSAASWLLEVRLGHLARPAAGTPA